MSTQEKAAAMSTAEKALETALEAVKQQITLATAVIGAALAFSDQLGVLQQQAVLSVLPWAFGLLGGSVIFGIFALMAISYELRRGKADPFGVKGVRLSGGLQNVTFMIAMALLAFTIASAAG